MVDVLCCVVMKMDYPQTKCVEQDTSPDKLEIYFVLSMFELGIIKGPALFLKWGDAITFSREKWVSQDKI